MTDRILITDHAVMRYVERVLGIDLEAVRATISGEVDHARARFNLANLPHRYAIRTGDAAYVISRNVVKTVLRPDGQTFFNPEDDR